MYKKLLAVGSIASAFLAAGVASFADTPTPIAFDAGVQADVLNLVTSYVTVAFALLGIVIAAVGTLWIAMRGIGLIFKYFHMFGH